MGAIKVPTNFNIELEFEITEFFERLLALVIDMVVQYFYIRIAIEIYKSIGSSDDPIGGIGLTLFLPVMVYHLMLEITLNGQSIGKKIMGLRVVDELGGKPSISQFLIRWLLRVSDLWIVILLLIVFSGMAGANTEQLFIVLLGLAFLTTDIVLVVASRKGRRIVGMSWPKPLSSASEPGEILKKPYFRKWRIIMLLLPSDHATE